MGPVGVLRHGGCRQRPGCPLPNGAHADAEWGWTPDGEPEGNLIVWIEDGRLAGLEYAVVADKYPHELPGVTLIREPLRRTEYVLHDDAWDDATRHAATDAALALIAPAATAASTDIPWDRRDSWPREVIKAAQRLDALVAREDAARQTYTQTGIMRLHDDQVRQDFVTFSPYAYDATIWADGEEVVSLADEGTSLVVALTDDQRDALTRVIGAGSLVTLQQWREQHPSALRRLLQRVTGKRR